jgi:hypothetical protein
MKFATGQKIEKVPNQKTVRNQKVKTPEGQKEMERRRPF